LQPDAQKDNAPLKCGVMHQLKPQMAHGLNMSNLQISFMEQNDIQQSAKVLSVAMLHNPNHVRFAHYPQEESGKRLQMLHQRSLSA
jgi:hypothetical protein